MSERTLLISGGMIVTDQEVVQHDVLISGERISTVGDLTDHDADLTIAADGLLVLPGAVDTHVHFTDVFMNSVSVHDYCTGTAAAPPRKGIKGIEYSPFPNVTFGVGA